jgi:hypothetical protein
MAFLLHKISRVKGLALACLVARVRLVDHIDATFAADDLAIWVTLLERFKGGGYFHGGRPFKNGRSVNKGDQGRPVNGISEAC